jgi:hypothetical protein
LLGYVRPIGSMRAFAAKLWEPWMKWAYGAGFDRMTEHYVRELGFEVVESRFVVADLMKLISVRTTMLKA